MLTDLFTGFLALAGVAALIAALINVGKAIGWVPDGAAPKFSLWLNLVFFALFVILSIFKPDVDIAGLDANAQAVAQLMIGALAFIGQLGVSRVSNAALRGTPLVGFSHSG